jgi:cyclohexanone monooxygenase
LGAAQQRSRDRTINPQTNSWYVRTKIPGKARIFMPYVSGIIACKKGWDEVAADRYQGFRLGTSNEAPRSAAE